MEQHKLRVAQAAEDLLSCHVLSPLHGKAPKDGGDLEISTLAPSLARTDQLRELQHLETTNTSPLLGCFRFIWPAAGCKRRVVCAACPRGVLR